MASRPRATLWPAVGLHGGRAAASSTKGGCIFHRLPHPAALLSLPHPPGITDTLRECACISTLPDPPHTPPSHPHPPGIYDTLKECACISKSAGGIGLSMHNIRATGSYIRGTNGTSNGIVPMLRVFNDTGA